ncbi:MAG: 3-beta hydroxysteroid dehydrogenase [Cellvibrionaceae bacterium]|nr:3-beta hydroxysteroid dehydrogenase [Cellvibrionaceae bacterium]
MGQRLEGKVALVTGGGSGIGEAISHAFADQGASIVVTDLNQAAACAVAEAINAKGGSALGLEQDVVDEIAWETTIQQVMYQYGTLDVLVNNAGIVIPGTIEDVSLVDWQKTDAVNVHGVYLGTQKAISIMKESGGGSIINISSIDGIIGDPKAIAYNASKGAVRTLSKSAALHCADSAYKIRVNSVHPGYILTPLVQQAFAEAGEEWMAEYERLKISRIPMGELGVPEDIAHGCVYLASDESRYVTGSELVIDGGFTAA